MKIAESTVSMTSSRSYFQIGSRAKGGNDKSFFDTANSMIGSEEQNSSFDSFERGRKEETVDGEFYPVTYSNISNRRKNLLRSANAFQYDLFRMIMNRIRGGMSGGNTMHLMTYQEYEETEFHAKGQAKTEDGRTIDFNVDILMSRSYMEYMDVRTPLIQNALRDPLVINTRAESGNISDQKFMFDIDCDGTEDRISMPGRGSGFLALDKNGDGIINDGNELFGAKSGDGFADLRKYDSDGNGWIDENDAVFNKLKVWCKGIGGEDILMDLKEADVGAIFLGSVATEFTLGGRDGIRDGVIRSTGFFLKESGGIGTVQHVDLAVEKNDSETLNNDGLVQGEDVVQTLTVDRGNNDRAARRQQEDSQKLRREKAIARKREEERIIKRRFERRKELKEMRDREYLARLAHHL
ncbi:MAG: WVD2 family protein [Lachnospiraceae bacterium]|nr:WVD2 family protein [Lachnospiraceae bacterium]